MVTQNTTQEISTRAMLVTLSIRAWKATKTDRKRSRKLIDEAGAEARSARVVKHLFDERALKDLTRITSQARALHYELTLPWSDAGPRILPVALYTEYREAMNVLKKKFNLALGRLSANYHHHITRAEKTLGDLFEAADYPSKDELRGKYQFSIELMPLPSSADFRAALTADEHQRIQNEIEERLQEEFKAATLDIAERIKKHLANMSARLNNTDTEKNKKGEEVFSAVFRDSMINNIHDMIRDLPSFNFTDDPDIAKLIEGLKPLVRFEAQDLRKDASARKAVAEDVDALLSDLSAFMG